MLSEALLRLDASAKVSVLNLYAISVIPRHPINTLFFDQTMNVGFKTRALHVEFSREFQVIDNFLIEDFAWHQQGNARWIRCDQTNGDATF